MTRFYQNKLFIKSISVVIGAPLFFLMIYFSTNVTFSILIGLISSLGIWEFMEISNSKFSNRKAVFVVFTSLLVSLSPIIFDRNTILSVIAVCGICFFWAEMVSADNASVSFRNLSIFVFGIWYISSFLAIILQLRMSTNGVQLIIILFFCTWSGDLGAGIAGKLFGRHKLQQKLNSNKSIEGIIVGIISTIFIAQVLVPLMFSSLDRLMILLLGIILGVFGQLGDLAESLIKRVFSVTDSSNLIPGQGGILDRMDSILFNAPFLLIIVTSTDWFN